VTMMRPGPQLKPGGPSPPATGNWRVDPARSRASFIAQIAGRAVRGSLPLTGQVLIAKPIEDSTALLAASATEVSTGSPALDRLLAGPGFLDAAAFPEIIFRSELLARVPAGGGQLAACKSRESSMNWPVGSACTMRTPCWKARRASGYTAAGSSTHTG
jgi:polyisoprenoid-binding protein YceI